MTGSKTYRIDVEDGSQIVLERLEELSIKNLDCEEINDSPSYGSASLPTPEAPHADFRLPMTALPSPYGGRDVGGGVEEVDDGCILPPGAPLIKDMDSFSQGSGCGSFDDLPATAFKDDQDELTPSTVSLLPPVGPLRDQIQKWQENIRGGDGEAVPSKRRRSPSPEPNFRRIRPRIRAISLPGRFKSFTHFLGYSTTRSEPEDPD